MIKKNNLNKINDVLWQVSTEYRQDMNVPANIYASQNLLEKILEDRSIEQLINVTTLPGIVKAALVMPDAHEGYGFPIGGVAATSWPDGVISPGGIGYDINCGVRLLRSELEWSDIEPHLEKLSPQIARDVPAGMGKGGDLKLSIQELDDLLAKGLEWMDEHGYCEVGERDFVESKGQLAEADPTQVSDKAKKRGQDQLGTLGSGNHFAEMLVVSEIFDKEIAEIFELRKDQVVFLIHTGSRGLGHQVATDYIKIMISTLDKYSIDLPDKELACAPLSSPEGQNYFKAMSAAANFAWSNRQLLAHRIRGAWTRILGESAGGLKTVYDVAHNMAKIEDHEVDGQRQKLIVHRKGATRAFGPGNIDIPSVYKNTGQPVLIPGSMGTNSYVLAGTSESMQQTFGSCCHGAGRQMSRHQAKQTIRVQDLRQDLKDKGIKVFARVPKNLSEEAPSAYKDVEEVVNTVQQAGLATKVASLSPKVVVVG